MQHNSTAIVTAICGDLMLAKECVADLKATGFPGEISVEPVGTSNVLQNSIFQAFGSTGGRIAGRGAILGALVGSIIGCLLAASQGAHPAVVSLAGAAFGTSIGGIIGWVIASGQRSTRGSSNDRFLLRCIGPEDQVTVAFAKLTTGPCHNALLQTHAKS